MLDLHVIPRTEGGRHSQAGEDLIVAAFIHLLQSDDLVMCEFGAHSGQNSNLLRFCEDSIASLIFLECDKARYRALKAGVGHLKNLTILEERVGWDEMDCLQTIFQRHKLIVEDVKIWSIDIDGDDYHVFRTIPPSAALVIVEYNPTFSFDSHFINPCNSNIGSSPLALVELAKSKNFFLAAMTETNLIFVHSRFANEVRKYDLSHISPQPASLRLALGYDGTIIVTDHNSQNITDEVLGLGWSSAFFVQPLPRVLRKFNRLNKTKSFLSLLQLLIIRPVLVVTFVRKCKQALRART